MNNVIYSYKKINNHGKSISTEFIQLARLSVESSNRFYKTKLYCDTESKLFFESHQIPFNEIIVLDDLNNYNGSVFSIPKIISMMEETEPYIHLDFDTVILNKIKYKENICFGYPEVQIHPSFNWKQIKYVYDAYITPFLKYTENKKELSETLLWNFDNIPNHGIMYVDNPSIIKNAYKEILSDFGDIVNDKKPIDGLAQYIEQFSLKKYLEKNKISYGFYEKICNFSFQMEDDRYDTRSITYQSDNLYPLLNNDFIHFHNHPLNTKLMNSIIDFLNDKLLNKKTQKIIKSLM